MERLGSNTHYGRWSSLFDKTYVEPDTVENSLRDRIATFLVLCPYQPVKLSKICFGVPATQSMTQEDVIQILKTDVDQRFTIEIDDENSSSIYLLKSPDDEMQASNMRLKELTNCWRTSLFHHMMQHSSSEWDLCILAQDVPRPLNIPKGIRLKDVILSDEFDRFILTTHNENMGVRIAKDSIIVREQWKLEMETAIEEWRIKLASYLQRMKRVELSDLGAAIIRPFKLARTIGLKETLLTDPLGRFKLQGPTNHIMVRIGNVIPVGTSWAALRALEKKTQRSSASLTFVAANELQEDECVPQSPETGSGRSVIFSSTSASISHDDLSRSNSSSSSSSLWSEVVRKERAHPSYSSSSSSPSALDARGDSNRSSGLRFDDLPHSANIDIMMNSKLRAGISPCMPSPTSSSSSSLLSTSPMTSVTAHTIFGSRAMAPQSLGTPPGFCTNNRNHISNCYAGQGQYNLFGSYGAQQSAELLLAPKPITAQNQAILGAAPSTSFYTPELLAVDVHHSSALISRAFDADGDSSKEDTRAGMTALDGDSHMRLSSLLLSSSSLSDNTTCQEQQQCGHDSSGVDVAGSLAVKEMLVVPLIDWLPEVLAGFEPSLITGFVDCLREEGFVNSQDLAEARQREQLSLQFLREAAGFKLGHYNRLMKALDSL